MELEELFNEYISLDKNESTLNEMLALKENHEELKKRLLTRMEFGTAGLRACMGAGYSMMNDLTIIQTAQGLLSYLQSQFSNLQNDGIVVGYDGRHHSREWALTTANIFTSANVPVYLFPEVCPTPFVPFSVALFGAACGVMVTASHNPKEDNGYKVYWANCAQIVSPHDKNIAAFILTQLTPRPESWLRQNALDHPLLRDPLPRVWKEYYDAAVNSLCRYPADNALCSLKFVYTAMHGVGYKAAREVLRRFGFPLDSVLIPVEEQIKPDPEFPTVRFPNPEEGRSALLLACATADRVNAPLILANDPDADRLAVAEKNAEGVWRIFNGNELGSLLGCWLWRQWSGTETPYFIASTVSSKLLSSLAKHTGAIFEETLTGFKWMGNRTAALKSQGHRVVFAFEEAIGFMCGDVVLDKDGVSALAVIAEMATQVYQAGSTLAAELEQIYLRYGYHVSNNGYYYCHEHSARKAMFTRLRRWPDGAGSENSYPSSCGRFLITSVRDLTTGYDSSTVDKRATLPTSTSSEMITFQLNNGCIITLRASGTEPKIKWYSELCTAPGDERDRVAMIDELNEVIDTVVKEFYQPEINGFVAQTK